MSAKYAKLSVSWSIVLAVNAILILQVVQQNKNHCANGQGLTPHILTKESRASKALVH